MKAKQKFSLKNKIIITSSCYLITSLLLNNSESNLILIKTKKIKFINKIRAVKLLIS